MKSGMEGHKGTPLVSEQRAPHPVRARFPPAGYLAGRQGNPCCGHLTGEEAGSFPVAAGIAQGGVCVGRKSPHARGGERTLQMAAAMGLHRCMFSWIGKAAMGDEGKC